MTAALLAMALHAEVRVFTSAAGTTLRGELVSVHDDTVTIKKEDGQTLTLKAAAFSRVDQAWLQSQASAVTAPAGGSDLSKTTKENPFVNSLGMKFVPVPETNVLFCTTLTRARDYNVFASGTPGVTPVKLGEKDDDIRPVLSSWDEAKAFCDRLSKKEGRVYRLPTDREWSFAVGIGSQESEAATPEQLNGKILVYPWGTQWPPPNGFANYADESLRLFVKKINYQPPLETIKGYKDGHAGQSPVQTFRPNKLGLYDMGGNLWQWCDDWYDAAKTKRCLRGGEWCSSKPADLLSSTRLATAPDFRTDGNHADVGFRCVLELASSSPQP